MSDLAFTLATLDEINGSAIFAFDRTCRMEIRRWWTPSPARWVAWLMLNPSDAGESRNDPTMLRIIHFSRSWGYDGLIGCNLYPFIASQQPEMWRRAAWEDNGPNWYDRDAIDANFGEIERIGRLASLRMAAFGASPIERDQMHLEECLEHFMQPADQLGDDNGLYCLGTNKHGQPLHPMARGKWRVSDSAKPILWRGS